MNENLKNRQRAKKETILFFFLTSVRPIDYFLFASTNFAQI